MNTLRILGLDDDNHGYFWVCEDGTRFETTKEVMEFLAKPHDCQVELKVFAIVEEWPACLEEKFSCEQVDMMFYHLEGLTSSLPDGMTPKATFDLFWESANKKWW